MRHLIVVLGDQLSRTSAAFDGFDPGCDAVWMAETAEETEHVWCHQLRIAFFLSAMRHFRDELRREKIQVYYHELTGDRGNDAGSGFTDILAGILGKERPERVILLEPGDFRVRARFDAFAKETSVPMELREDRDFYCTHAEFAAFAGKGKRLLLETFYERMRRTHRILLDESGGPVGGAWNFDKENRESFGATGPRSVPAWRGVKPDAVTREVMEMVAVRFPKHPGRLEHFDLPVTRADAQKALRDFVTHRLPTFGVYQDAMWRGEPFLFHSRLSAAMNVKLLSPREVVDAALHALERGHAPLNSVEGFVRQILGWREYMRGIYWHRMPGYARMNTLGAELDVPAFYWNGKTEMECMRQGMQNVLDHAYAHHIQRLMVFGNFALLFGVHPYRFHEWHMAMYADAIDWVSLGNTLGMSQYGDGGLVATKPYISTGNYIHKMSDYCRNCFYKYNEAVGEKACPFTTLYYDFLGQHAGRFEKHPRMFHAMHNLGRKSSGEMEKIHGRAMELRRKFQ